ncbi:MAG TPA: PAS domain-containing sensor histidine kinase [Methanotrichaceae archaeon]|nr:PAS domain-containing sensor histidine kinase [Methanotrichaceae archaeon]
MIDNSPHALYLVDGPTGSVLYFNHSFSQFWSIQALEDKMERGEIKESDILSHIYPLLKDVSAFSESHYPHPDEFKPSSGEMPLLDGRVVHWFSANIRDDYGCCLGRLNIFEDITERRLAENALRASEEMFRSVFEESPAGIQICDSHGRLVKANQASMDMLGVSPEEVTGLNIFEDSSLGSDLADRLRNGEAVRYEKAITLCEAGKTSIRHVCLIITPLRTAESFNGYVVQVQEITDRKKAETLLEETVEELKTELSCAKADLKSEIARRKNAEQALNNLNIDTAEGNRAQKEFDDQKAEFISLASHEMRTPLSVINSYLELFADGALGVLTESQNRKLQIIQAQNDRLISIVDTLLDVYDVDVKNLLMQTEPVDLAMVARSALDGVSRLAGFKEHRLNLTAESGLPSVAGDERRLYQAFYNILTNAVKYTPDNGMIEIRIWREGSSVLTAIIDNGKGIPEKNQERIFKPFFIGEDGSLAREDRRMGLGLALVKRIIEAHRGRIWIESKVGKGSTFYIALPCT